MSYSTISPANEAGICKFPGTGETKRKNAIRPALFVRWMLALLMLCTTGAYAQFAVTTNSGSGLNPTYPNLAAAITALNGATITSPVVITCPTGTETAPAGGYSITAQGTALNTIIIQGNGAANSIITAFNPQTSGGRLDGIFKIVGGDFITIQGFRMQENAANATTTLASNNMTEFGVGVFYTTATNGAQNNTIQNNTIVLGSYQNTIGIYSTSGHSSTSATVSANATSNAGLNSGLKIYGNTISSVAFGVYAVSVPNTATITETGIEIGGAGGGQGNTITYGNNTVFDAGFVNFSTASAAISYRNGVNASIKNNNITSNSMTIATFGVSIAAGTNPTGVTYTNDVSGNTINLTETGTTVAVNGIIHSYGLSTGTIINNSNTITINQTVGAATASTITGILAAQTSATNTANLNNITINQTTTGAGATSTTLNGVNLGGTATTSNALNNTILFNQTTSSTSAVTSPVNGILANSAATTCNVGGVGNGNTITIQQAQTGSGTYGSGAITYINVSAAHGTVNVVANSLLTGGSPIRSTGALIGVFQDATVSALVNVKSNAMTVDRVATSGSVIFQSTSGTPSEVADTISNNTITFTGLAGTTSATAVSSLGGPGSPLAGNKNINNNIISISGTNSGTIIGITAAFTNTGFIKGNSVTISTASATVTGITTSGTAMTITGNSLSLSSSVVSATAMSGIAASGSTGNFSISNNTISSMNFSAVLTNGPNLLGISYTGTTTGTMNVSNNNISNISVGASGSTGSATITAISVERGILTISKNTICSVSTTLNGAATLIVGLRINGSTGTSSVVSNNRIANLSAPAAVTTDAIRGISFNTALASTTVGMYYNTVYINSSATGATFGTSGLYHVTSTSATSGSLDLRNNIIVNTSAFAGAGTTVAFRRSTGTANHLANYAGTSDRNLFYAGIPGANNLIYSDGTSSAQTIGAYKGGTFTAGTIAPRDANSISENPSFLSTACGNANFLRIDPSIATGIESGGAVIGVVVDDFEGDTRNAVTPDLGADEFTGTPLPLCTGTPVASTITGGAASVCTGLAAPTLTLSNVYTDLGITYQWRSSTVSGGPYTTTLGTSATQATGNITATTYFICEITCTNSGLTYTTVEKEIIAKPIPTATAGSNSPVCAGSTLNLNGGTDIGTSFGWTGPNGFNNTSQNPSISNVTTLAAGTYNFTATLDGCSSAPSPTVVVVNPTPVAPTTTGYSICLGASIPPNQGLVTTAVGAGVVAGSQTINFDVAAQPTETNTAPGNIVASATMTALPAGATVTGITITYNGITALGTSYQNEVRLGLSGAVINSAAAGTGAAAAAGLFNYTRTTSTGITATLAGGTVNLLYWDANNDNPGAEATFPTGTAVASVVVNYTYPDPAAIKWYDAATGGNLIGTGTPFNPIGVDPALPNSNTAGTYTYYAEISTGSCPSLRTAASLVIGAALSAGATASPNTPVCEGTSVTLSGTPTGGSPAYTYSWKVGITEVSTAASFSVTPSSTTQYDLTISDGCAQTATASVTVTVNPLPAVVVVSTAGTYCGSTTLTAANGNDGTIYFQGTTSNGTSTATPSASQLITSSGTYYFRAQSAAGCWGPQGSAVIVINPNPPAATVTPASPATICLGSSQA